MPVHGALVFCLVSEGSSLNQVLVFQDSLPGHDEDETHPQKTHQAGADASAVQSQGPYDATHTGSRPARAVFSKLSLPARPPAGPVVSHPARTPVPVRMSTEHTYLLPEANSITRRVPLLLDCLWLPRQNLSLPLRHFYTYQVKHRHAWSFTSTLSSPLPCAALDRQHQPYLPSFLDQCVAW